MSAYVVNLSGQGDTDIKIVDKETFEWIISEDLGRPDGKTGWDDKTCPNSVRKRMWDEMDLSEQKDYGGFEGFYPYITIGSVHNDRALYAPAMKTIEGNDLSFHDTASYTNYVTRNALHVEDSFEGYIY